VAGFDPQSMAGFNPRNDTMMPLNTLKNAEICTGRERRYPSNTSSLLRLLRPISRNDAAENAEKR
jgi:hypothetical protein